MIEAVSDIRDLYDGDPEREDERLERHQLEYDITLRYFDAHLPPEGPILEIGAGTGRYTAELARRGHPVTAVDLSKNVLAKCRERIAGEGLENVRIVVADARDLAGIPEKDFASVLIMGPLYHLVVEEDRKTALREACDRLREGGILFSAWISRMGIFADLLKNIPDWIEDHDEVRAILERGMDPDHYPKGGFRGYFATTAEIAPIHESLGLQSLVLAAAEPVIAADDESYNRLLGNPRRLWQDLLFALSTEASILASSRHLLYIGKKPERQGTS
ncbi:MAG: class I SAM-dependent methyltransferase [Planctomycetota bacterium]|jgi:SAM-dependent methyltransferase